MRRPRGGARLWGGLAAAVLLVVLGVTSPWWFTFLLWREGNTSWVELGPGVDPASLAVTNASAAGPPRIPAIIHQTWRSEEVPAEWRGAQAACRALHPGWEYRLWTNAGARALIAERFPQLLATYDAYPHAIQRADALRYAVLQEFGGFYIDLDIECARPLDFLRRFPAVLPKTWPVGLSNDFMGAEPGSAFMRQLVAALPRWAVSLLLKYPTVMFSTGPMLVTLQASFFPQRRDLWVLRDSMYGKYVAGGQPLFRHLFGSSWHGDDAKSALLLLPLLRHPFFLAVLTLTGLLAMAAILWRQLARPRSARRASKGGHEGEGGYTQLTHIMTAKDS